MEVAVVAAAAVVVVVVVVVAVAAVVLVAAVVEAEDVADEAESNAKINIKKRDLRASYLPSDKKRSMGESLFTILASLA